MSVNLNNAAVEEFMSDVLHALKEINYSDSLIEAHSQAGGLVKRNVVGEVLHAPNYGDAYMVDRGAATSVITGQDISKERKSTQFTDKVFLSYTDIFAQQDVNFDDLEQLKKVCVDAKKREDNQFTINKIANETYNTDIEDLTAGYDIGTTAAGEVASVSLIKKVARVMNEKGVPMEGRVFLVTPAFVEQLMEDPKFTSIDYADRKALVEGTVSYFHGFKFVKISNKVNPANGDVYGLPKDDVNNTVACFAYQVDGLVPGFRATTERNIDVQWHQERQSFGVSVTTSGGCVVRQPARIVRVFIDNSI